MLTLEIAFSCDSIRHEIRRRYHSYSHILNLLRQLLFQALQLNIGCSRPNTLKHGKAEVPSSLVDLELTKDGNTRNLKLPLYSDLLMSAARQYAKDLERIKEKASQELPASKLAELELDIEAVKGCLR